MSASKSEKYDVLYLWHGGVHICLGQYTSEQAKKQIDDLRLRGFQAWARSLNYKRDQDYVDSFDR